MSIKNRTFTRVARSSALAVSVVAGMTLATAGAATAAPATAAAGTCTTTRTVCLWDQVDFGGEKFTAQALNPATGTCVSLAAHGWGNGRTKSARNTGNQVARLYTTTNCTGTSYQIVPGGAYTPITFASNSIYVY